MTSPLQRKLKINGPTVVTANRLADGVVVWLTGAGEWSEAIEGAAIASTAEEVGRLLDIAQGDENRAVGAYPAAVKLSDAGVPQPANLRERIRSKGPTVAFPTGAAPVAARKPELADA